MVSKLPGWARVEDQPHRHQVEGGRRAALLTLRELPGEVCWMSRAATDSSVLPRALQGWLHKLLHPWGDSGCAIATCSLMHLDTWSGS